MPTLPRTTMPGVGLTDQAQRDALVGGSAKAIADGRTAGGKGEETPGVGQPVAVLAAVAR